MAWSLRGRVRYLLEYEHFEHDFRKAIEYAENSFSARAMWYLCKSEKIVSKKALYDPDYRLQAIEAAQELLDTMGELELNTQHQAALNEWRGDMEHYRKVHQELIDEANKS